MKKNIHESMKEEFAAEADFLRKHSSYIPEYEYFIETLYLQLYPDKIMLKHKKPCVNLYCVQAPLELIDALGFQPLRLSHGSSAIHKNCAGCLPSLACPVVKSSLGAFMQDDSVERNCVLTVLPSTCDWNVKMPAFIQNHENKMQVMELPHLKDSEKGRQRWLEEVFSLKKVLERISGTKLDKKNLLSSMAKYAKARSSFNKITDIKRAGVLPGIWYAVIANAFMTDDVRSWAENVDKVTAALEGKSCAGGIPVFLAGSPASFPYLKPFELIEVAGMSVIADELCSSERVFPGGVTYNDSSDYGLLEALSERYMLYCSCPTYSDNERRITKILNTVQQHGIKGIVYHLLKGCHPYDIESFLLEKAAREKGLRFIKMETDYSPQDRQNILTRLEAFRESLT